VVAAAALIAGMAGPASAAPTASSAERLSVIVQEVPGSGTLPEQAVAALGGTVDSTFEVIDGFTATMPSDRLGALRATAGVLSVTENAQVTLTSTEVDDQAGLKGSLQRITHEMTGAAGLWDAGYTGAGVDVAMIDSGVVPVDGLRSAGKVVYGPDLSFEARVCTSAGCKAGPAANLDTYGHGTHMAGIIAGRDDAAPATVGSAHSGNFVGVAPDARIVSIKIADAQGRTDVSQAIAAIDWVIQHKNRGGLNIRVLNMSFGTDGVQSYLLDPLAYAAEQAWHKGIVVVVAAGNSGYGSAKLNNPAYDPYVLAVGGSDGLGTATTDDDIVASWSAGGDGTRNPDVVAPGASVVSLRVPNSQLDAAYPGARTGERFFRGSGTSQAAAVVSGAAALLLEQRPELKPDQVKALLTGTAKELPSADAVAQGEGLIDLAAASAAATPNTVQTFQRSTGAGSIEKARGSVHVQQNGQKLTGERDVTGRAFSASTVAKAIREGSSWSGGSMTSRGWDGGAWLGEKFFGTKTDAPSTSLGGQLSSSGLSWSGLSWSGLSWSGLSWSGLSWSGLSWSGLSWSGLSWSGLSWSGLSWSGLSWS
jgi:serine protease AprX